MKKSFVFVCMFLSVMLFAECKKGNVTDNGILTIKNAAECKEVTFEDVATNIRIVPLISDGPLDGCNRVQCYGSTAVIRTYGGEGIYIFEDGKQIAYLHKVGRGRGEYSIISTYAYSPTNKILYISSGFSSIHKYSVPDLNYLGTFEIHNVIAFAEHDDSTLICRMENNKTFGEFFINTDNGQTRGMVKELGGIGALNDDLSYYTPSHRILSEIGAVFTISEVPAQIGDEEKIILRYNFGKDSWPLRFDSIDINHDVDGLMEMAQFLNENQETMIAATGFTIADDNAISFWYRVGLVGEFRYMRICRDEIVKYSGFKAKGMKKSMIPTGLSDDGYYVTIIEGLPESVFDESDERSEFTSDLEKAINAQSFNNPVLVYYKIK